MPDPQSQDSVAAFAADLSEARRAAGRSIRQVHQTTGIPTATLGGYFAGRHLPPVNRPEVLHSVLQACGVPAREHPRWRARLLALHAQRRHVEVTRTPYPGLRPFEAGDADLFFGREALLDQLLALLEEAVGGDDPVVAVVGPSGSGKSSLLRAGLQAGLRDAECVVCRPAEVGAALEELAEPAGEGAKAEVRQVLVVDQLEELWTHRNREARADGVLGALRRWTAAAPGRVLVVGLRADFYGEAMTSGGLTDALRDRQLLVEPLDAAGMRVAIEGPARHVGLSLEPGLADVILADVRHDAVGSVLPHLAHVLDTMWSTSDRRALTVEDYRRAGGFEGAIRQSAEEALTSLPPEQQGLAMTLLLRMVATAPAQGWTRRLVPLGELTALGEHAPEVLHHLVARRLVTVRTDDATLSHESLVGAWPRLKQAVEARRGDLARREALDRAARDWDAHGRGEDHLLRGSRLEAALDWSVDAPEPLTPLQQDYLAASRQLGQRLEQERRAGHRRRRAVVAAMTVLLLLTTVAGLAAVRSSAETSTERDQAQSRQMAVAAANLRTTNPALSQQLAVAAHRAAPTREGRSAVLDATTTPFVAEWSHDDVVVERVAYLPDEEHLVLAGPQGGVLVIRAAGDGPWEALATVPLTREDGLAPVVSELQTHGRLPLAVAAGSFPTGGAPEDDEPLLALLDLSDPASPDVTMLELPGPPTAVALAEEGGLLHVAVDEDLLRFALTDDGAHAPVGEPVDAGGVVVGLGTSADGRFVAAGLDPGEVRTWKAQGSELTPAGGHDTGRPLFEVDVAHDGSVVAAVGRSGLVHWLDVQDDDSLVETHGLFASDTVLYDVDLDLEEGVLATAGFEGTTWAWMLDDAGPLTEAPNLVLPVPRPVLDLDVVQGRWVFGTLGGTVYTWDQRSSYLPRLPGNVFLVGTSAEAERYMTSTGAPDGAVTIWDATEPHAPRPVHTLRASGDDVSGGAGALSPDGSLAAMGTGGGRLLVWRVDGPDPEPLVDVTLSERGLPFVLFAPDSASVLGFDLDGGVHRVALQGGDRGEVVDEVNLRGGLMSAGVRDDGLVAFSDDVEGVRLVQLDDLATTVAAIEVGPSVHVYGLEFSPDGSVLALSGSDNNVYLYDVSDPASPTLLGEPLTGPTSITNSVKFSPDGERLAVAVIAGQAWIYTQRDGGWEPTEVLRAGLVNLQDVTWSPDGSVLLGGALAGRTRLWLTDVEEAVHLVCSNVGHHITEDEWEGLLPGIEYDPPCLDTDGSEVDGPELVDEV